jgi:hypothetical protein
MLKLRDFLSATNVMILVIMAGGNLILGIASYVQEFDRTNCIRQAIYEKATESQFTSCLKSTGFFDIDGTTWIFL